MSDNKRTSRWEMGGGGRNQELMRNMALPGKVYFNLLCIFSTYCGSPADYGLPRNFHENDIFELSYNFLRFDDFFYSLLVVFTFLNITGWSGTNYMFWKSMTTYVTALYFVTLIILLAYILSNVLLGILYESFVV